MSMRVHSSNALGRRLTAATTLAALVVGGLGAAVSMAVPLAATAQGSVLLAESAHPGSYHPVGPARLLDQTLSAAGTVTLPVTGSASIPSSGVGAVLINVTVATPQRGGYVTVYPAGGTRPATSNVNFVAGATVANAAVIRVGAGGGIRLYNASGGSIRLVVDVSGYFVGGTPDGAGLVPMDPVRVLDTGTAAVAAHQTVTLPMRGHFGLPPFDVQSALLNVTVAAPKAAGYATVYPSGQARPGTSTLNFPVGRTVPNLAVAQVGSDGAVNIYNGSNGTLRLVVDLFGYFPDRGASHPGEVAALASARVMDTRSAAYPGAPGRVVPAHGLVQLNLSSRSGLPKYAGGAVVLNVTVTQPKGSGYITVYPGGAARPPTSSLNFSTGRTLANLVVARPNSAGTVSFYNGSAQSVQLIADLSGYLTPAKAVRFDPPQLLTHPTAPAAAACATSALCLAAAGKGRVSSWNGITWRPPMELFSATEPSVGMACPSAAYCIAVSAKGHARTFDGFDWAVASSVGTVAPGLVTDVSCRAAASCVAVDSSGRSHLLAGTTWTTSTLTTHRLDAVSCTPAYCMAVTTVGSAFRLTGTSWVGVPASVLSVDGVIGLQCFTDGTCLLLDPIGEGRRFNGSAWTTGFGSSLGTPDTFGCVSATYCVATDGPTTATYDGTSWTNRGSAPSTTAAMACTGSTTCLGVTGAGGVRTFDGSAWSAEIVLDAPLGTPTDISCTGASLCAVVTSAGSAVTGDGQVWSAPAAITAAEPIVAVSCFEANLCVAVSATLAATFDGESWAPATTLDPTGQLVDVSCSSLTFCLALTTDSRAYRYLNGFWSSVAPAPAVSEADEISCASSTGCTAVVDRRWVSQFNGTTWSAPAKIAGVDVLTGLSCRSDGFCGAVDAGGAVYSQSASGAAWSAALELTPAGNGLSSISCGGGCVATVNGESDVYTFDGEVWTNSDDFGSPLVRVSCGGIGFCVAYDDLGRVRLGAST
jgi:hypothetical protein